MRENLFRGKRTLTKEWVEGSLLVFMDDVAIVPCETALVHYISPETVGQFTGLPDKNGKKIFEGDICRVVRNGVPLRGVVEFFRGAFGLRYDTGEFNSFVYLNRLESTGSVFSTIEVIGNIHDNPELLEVTE